MKLNFQRDWRECSNPQIRFQVQNQSIESRHRLKKIERNNKFRSYPRKRVSLKRMRKKKKRKKKIAHGSCDEHVHAHALPTHLSIRPCGGRDNDNFIAFWCRPTCRRDNGPGRYATGQDRYVGATYSQTRVGFRLLRRCDRLPAPFEAAIFHEQVALSPAWGKIYLLDVTSLPSFQS